MLSKRQNETYSSTTVSCKKNVTKCIQGKYEKKNHSIGRKPRELSN